MRTKRSFRVSLILLVSIFPCVKGQYSYKACGDKFNAIINGTHAIGDINNITITRYLYNGSIPRLKANFRREDYLALTDEGAAIIVVCRSKSRLADAKLGCRLICGEIIQLNQGPPAMTLAATWIIPLAIILNLPYNASGRKWRRFLVTLSGIGYWLGSPEMALTATVFNVVQIDLCHRIRKFAHLNTLEPGSRGENEKQAADLWTAVFYTLSCFNQYKHPDESSDVFRKTFMPTLAYGLLRPLSFPRRLEGGSVRIPVTDEERRESEVEKIEIEMLQELVHLLASQLRRLRMQGMVATLTSLALFVIGTAFAIIQAFVEGGDSQPILALTSGLLFSFIPILVTLSIVDRNANSSEASA